MVGLRVIGWLILLAAVLALGWDGFNWMQSGHWAMTPAGKTWYRLSPGSLNLMQAVIERHVWKTLWNPVILTVLLMPTWLVLGVPGGLLAILARPRKHRRFARSRPPGLRARISATRSTSIAARWCWWCWAISRAT